MLRLLLLLSFYSSVFGQRRTLITLRSDDGKWLSVKEVVKGQEYWLRPISVLESARKCDACREGNEFILSVRFWNEELLIIAGNTLRLKGFCQKDDPCHVTPYQAERIVLRDALQRWRTLVPWTPVGGMIPETQDFMIGPLKTRRQGDVDNASLTTESLSSFHMSIVSSDLSSSSGTEQLIYTGEDLAWAHRLFKIPGSNKENKLIDRKSLRRLAVWLLKMKTKDMSGALPLFPTLMARVEQQLTITSVKFRQGMEKLIQKGYSPTEGETFYLLKKVAPKEKLFVTFTPNMRLKSITMGLKISKLFELSDAPPKVLVETEKNSILPIVSSTQKPLTNLSVTARLQLLERKVTTLIKVLNISSSLQDYPDIPLLRSQVSKLASMLNATHVMDRENINLTAIDDCYEVKKNKMKGSLFFLRSLKRPVECTREGDIVVLKRSGGKIKFNETWANYERGIGNVRKGDFFIGLKDLSALTHNKDMCMNLILTPWKLSTSPKKATYDSFSVGPSSDKYRLSYANYKGTLVFDVMSVMNNQRFSTYDNDNDDFVGNCAMRYKSGNWYQSCMKANIFGPYSSDATSGMCSIGIDSSQGDMCSPLASVRMLIRKKENSAGSRKIVFSDIASQSSCSAKLKIFTVPAAGLYKVTIGGAQGGRYNHQNSRLGGRGAKVAANFYLEKGTELGISAGCRGSHGSSSGHGGDASWLVSRSRKVLLAVAGGGGGAGYYKSQPFIPGMHGRATTDGGDSWWSPYTNSGSANSTLLINNYGSRAKGWRDLRDRFLNGKSGRTVSSGGQIGGQACGGGGGGYKGGIQFQDSAGHRRGGGGGGSFCNPEKGISCSVTAGGNTRPYGYVIIERNYCF